MKKSIILFISILLILNIFVIASIRAESPPVPSLPGIGTNINPDTGLPVELEKFQEIGNQLSQEEQRKAYLKQEWTKIFANNKFFGPFLFYTDKIFSFFNPFWKVIFSIEFSWSWAFIFSFLIWVLIIIFVYSPLKSFTELNRILVLIMSLSVASLAGIGGAISQIIVILTALITNAWILWTSIIIGIILTYVYYRLLKDYGKKAKAKDAEEKEKLDRKRLHGYSKAISDSMK